MVSLPLSVYSLRTSYFKVHVNTKPPEDVKRFGAIAWEVLNTLKENFPSHIHLYQENLEACEPYYKPMTAKEELRRQVSCLMSKQEAAKPLLQEEIDDVWYLLEACLRNKEEKGATTCLEILDSAHHCPEQLLQKNAEETDMKLLETIVSSGEESADTGVEINCTLAKKIMLKIKEGQMPRPAVFSEKDMNRSASGEPAEEISFVRNFDQPPSLRVCVFQLSESNDLERVTFILQTISKYSKGELQLLKKSAIVAKVVKVLQKYCNGEYGFDQEIAKLGIFQYCVTRCLIALSDNLVDFMDLVQSNALTMLGQIVEEALIYVYDKTINGCMEWNSKLQRFVWDALTFFELGVNLKCSKYYDGMRTTYSMLRKRLLGLTTQELSIEKVFRTYFDDKQIVASESATEMAKTETAENSDLKVVCPSLHASLVKINELSTKLEALQEYAETHQEKYAKLFSAPTAPTAISESKQLLSQPTISAKAGMMSMKVDRDTTEYVDKKLTI